MFVGSNQSQTKIFCHIGPGKSLQELKKKPIAKGPLETKIKKFTEASIIAAHIKHFSLNFSVFLWILTKILFISTFFSRSLSTTLYITENSGIPMTKSYTKQN